METKPLCLGKIGAPQGLKGFVRVHSWTEPKTQIFDYQPWTLSLDHGQQKLSATLVNKGKYIVAKIDTINDREQAQLLTHAEIHIERSQLPQVNNNEYFLTDLIDAEVVNNDKQLLGTVEDIVNYGASDIIVVKQKSKTHYIPLIKPTINMIDLEHKKIIVDWDENF